jgi:hypothetical protein
VRLPGAAAVSGRASMTLPRCWAHGWRAGALGGAGLGAGLVRGFNGALSLQVLNDLAPNPIRRLLVQANSDDRNVVTFCDQAPHMDVRDAQQLGGFTERKQLLLDLHARQDSDHALSVPRNTYCARISIMVECNTSYYRSRA